VVELKALESKVGSNSESDPYKGKQIIDAEPSATTATTKVQPSEQEEPKEGEFLFHSQMWVKGDPFHFIIDRGIQKNLISTKVIKQLDLLETPHLEPYTISPRERYLHHSTLSSTLQHQALEG